VRNEKILTKIGEAPIEEKIRKNHLRWFSLVRRRPTDAPGSRAYQLRASFSDRRGDQRKHGWR